MNFENIYICKPLWFNLVQTVTCSVTQDQQIVCSLVFHKEDIEAMGGLEFENDFLKCFKMNE